MMMLLPRPPRVQRPASRVRRALGLASVGLLVAFHAVLLWERLVDSTLFEPVPAIRWLATVALMGVLYRLHRNGLSMFRGRGAVVLWLLVLLLHVSFWGPLADPAATGTGWDGWGLLLALPAFTFVPTLLAPILRRLLGWLAESPEPPERAPIGWLTSGRFGTLQTGFLPVLASRPPPIG
jgi:hypothetical protein